MSKRLLLLTPMPEGSGNRATAQRLHQILSPYFAEIFLEDSYKFDSFTDLSPLITKRKINTIFLIHAYHSGRLLVNSDIKIPVVTIFGGTDLHSPKIEWRESIENSIKLSEFLVCFNETMREICLNNWPDAQHKCVVIPQGVHVEPDQSFSLKKFDIDGGERCKVISWVGSIRAVKDPLFIESLLNAVRKIDENLVFVYAGYSLDDVLSEKVAKIAYENANFRYIGGVSGSTAHALIASSWAFLNTSLNEGMSLSILEAMKLGVPVLARFNFGNCSLVSHLSTGFVYASADELLQCIRLVCSDDALRERVVKNALSHVDSRHSLLFEQKAYESCLKALNM